MLFQRRCQIYSLVHACCWYERSLRNLGVHDRTPRQIGNFRRNDDNYPQCYGHCTILAENWQVSELSQGRSFRLSFECQVSFPWVRSCETEIDQFLKQHRVRLGFFIKNKIKYIFEDTAQLIKLMIAAENNDVNRLIFALINGFDLSKPGYLSQITCPITTKMS